jgi:uncharacterized protein YneF (UPF0154 family)
MNLTYWMIIWAVGAFLLGLMTGFLVAKRQWQKGEWY